MKTFTIGEREYEVRLPRGRAGRRATNFLIKRLSAENAGMASIIDVLDDKEFETKHLPVILGVDADVLEVEGTTAEILGALMAVVEELFSAFQEPDVEEAVKN